MRKLMLAATMLAGLSGVAHAEIGPIFSQDEQVVAYGLRAVVSDAICTKTDSWRG
jgi:hypothetical protein